jgi:hypothetical protein
VPAARRQLPGRHRSDHELPPAALDVADAGRGVRRDGERPRRLPRGGRAGLPLLQLRRRDADPREEPA